MSNTLAVQWFHSNNIWSANKWISKFHQKYSSRNKSTDIEKQVCDKRKYQQQERGRQNKIRCNRRKSWTWTTHSTFTL